MAAVHTDLLFCSSGRAAAAGLRGPGARSDCGDSDHEGRAGRFSFHVIVL